MSSATLDSPTSHPDELEAPPLSLRELTWRRFRRHKMAIFGAVVLILLVGYAFVPAFFIPKSYANHTDTSLRLNAPSAAHPFGTDTVGRDILARTIYGGQISIIIGLTAAILEVLVGILIGAIAGYYGGRDRQRLDALYRGHAESSRRFSC